MPDILSSIILARIGPEGPHIITLALAIFTVSLIGYKLRPKPLPFVVLIFFGWQLEEMIFAYTLFAARQTQGYPGWSFLWGYLVSGSFEVAIVAMACGLFYFYHQMRWTWLWLGMAATYIIWFMAGTPTSLATGTGSPIYPHSVSVSLMEESTIMAFCLAFYNSFRYPK